MNKKIALSIEQMKHLESLGLDTSDASMEWQYVSWEGYELKVCNDNCVAGELGIPAYTLQDILEITKLIPFSSGFNCAQNSYIIVTLNPHKTFGENSLLQAAYQMLLWCIENGYIKTNKV